jgi:hypothetical protein
MAKYRGVNLIVEWISPAGTQIMSLPSQELDVQREIDLIDVTSGSDLDHEYIVGNKKASITYKFFDDTAGTAILASLVEGTFGTLLWGPQGTAAGKLKQGCQAYVKKLDHKNPFDKAVDVQVDFEKNNAMLFDFASVWP